MPLVLLAAAAGAAERYDPRLRFRTTRTAHFDIHAHQGEEALARRLAGIAERVRQRFEPVFGVPRGRVQVILVDQTDLSNGWATPFPYDAIEITAVPPPTESLIGNTTDWLEIVFTHEYTHILHLDRTRGFMQGVRRVFGRVPLAFPNGFLPVWQVEGIATYEESRMTGEGRVPAGDFRAIVDVAGAAGRFEPLDRVSGGLSDWPSGHGPYAYGAYFHQFLADRYGPERLSRLADATAGRAPLFGSGAIKRVFGKPVTALWEEFKSTRERTALPSSATDASARRLTHHGSVVTAPRVAGDGTIYYSVVNPDGFPALMRLSPGTTPSRVAWRALGGRTSVHDGWIVFDQVARVRSVALYSDLYAVRASGGDVRRLTQRERAADPDVSPDGKHIVCTVQSVGRRALALLDFSPSGVAQPQTLVDDAEADFTGPRWSPDGRRIVASRRRAQGYDLVLIDPGTKQLEALTPLATTRMVTPSWSPDGTAVLFAADPRDQPFNVFVIDLATRAVRQATDTRGGAQFPELTRDGRLTYVGYTPEGNDLFSIETNAAAWTATGSDVFTVAKATAPDTSAAREDPVSPYRPWRTLAPTYWSPIVDSDAGETVFGAGVAMTDALGRHAYAIDAGWTGHRARPDWHASYAYDRWRPTLFASYADDTDPVRAGDVRSRELLAGALLRLRHVRFSDTFLAAFDAERDTLSCGPACASLQRDLRSIRGGWLHDSRRRFGYSISSEEGFALELGAESSRTALGSDVNAGAGIFDLRGFTRAFGRHSVLAARVAGAASWGAANTRRVFSAAGSGPSEVFFDFGRDSIGLIRGVSPEDAVGTRAAVANLDLRIPFARPQRGYRSWPVFLHSLHGALFADAGHAWDTSFRAADLKTSIGGELSADLVVLHFVPLTIAGGAAWTRDPSADRRGAAFFARVGYAF